MPLDVFAMRDQLATDHREYAGSFLTLNDERVGTRIEPGLARGLEYGATSEEAETWR
jgi:hypothetical protein